MATREEVIELLDHGHTYETAARALGITPGLVYMTATGRPADGSHDRFSSPLPHGLPQPDSPQRLTEPPPFNPTRKAHVAAWVRERARRDLRAAAR